MQKIVKLYEGEAELDSRKILIKHKPGGDLYITEKFWGPYGGWLTLNFMEIPKACLPAVISAIKEVTGNK